jgi:hypothetical protein
MRTAAVIGALVLIYLYQIGSLPEPQPEPVSAAQVVVDADRERWAVDLLTRLGNTQPTAATVAFVVAWTLAEDSGMGAFARNNPLNTTQEGFSATGAINEDGVKGYATREDGLNATVQTLSYGYYTEIVAGLQTNDPQRAFNGLINSPWASSHYNYGRDWPGGIVQ